MTTPAPLILGVLQNQWFKDPARVRESIDRHPAGPAREQFRRAFIKRALFYGCRTGINLRKCFGEWCDRMVWEEASREIGGHAGAAFVADPIHLRAVLDELQPVAVVAFGNIAWCALQPLVIAPATLIRAPHPTARQGDTLRNLYTARHQLETLLESHA